MIHKYIQFALLLALLFMHEAPDVATAYYEQVQVLAVESGQIRQSFGNVSNPKDKQELTDKTSRHLYLALTERMFPFWYGTQWDFNGTTQKPRHGKIACGYFVTTLLRDVGFDVERVKLAQQSSEKIIRTLVGEANIVRFSNTPMENFVAATQAMGNGLYLVGLDTHIGFLLVAPDGLRFIHAAYSSSGVVKSEPVWECKVLLKSKYRVVGKLLADTGTLEQWLQNKKFSTVQ